MKQLTTKEFIEKAQQVHGDKYDYSKVEYINNYTKVIIICPIHGKFEQIPNSHLLGFSCIKCKYEKLAIERRLSQEKFIEKAIAKHGDKYDYSKVIYIDAFTKVTIICPIHGEFLQNPGHHLFGQGCPICRYKKSSLKNSLSTEQFIEKAKVIHGDKYDYSKTVYINTYTKVIIICQIHGEFIQTPNHHLRGSCCHKCSTSKGELAIESILKKHNIEAKLQYRIPEVANELYYDFYLPDYNLLIEFHGIQHYEYVPFFHDGNYTLSDQKTRDDIVRYNAKNWKYNYLKFNYKQLKHMTKEQFEELVIAKINNNISNKVTIIS